MAASVQRFNSLRFPQDLGTNEVPYYIRFEPQVVQYGGTRGLETGVGDFNLVNFGNNTRTPVKQTSLNNQSLRQANNIGGLKFDIAQSVNNVFQNLVSNLKSATLDIFNTGLSGRVNITKPMLNQGIETDRNILFNPGSINLYLPESLSANSSVDYSATELGQAGMAAVEIARRSGTDAFRKDGEGKSQIGNMLAQLGAGALQDMTQADDRTRSAFTIAKGQVANNFSFQIFNGVGHRSFSYDFKMVPRDEADSKTIKEICDTFVYYMLPSKSTQGEFNFYEVPCQWNISYQGPQGKLQYHQQPKPCFLQSVNVDYGGDTTNNLYNDGAPMTVTMQLEFVEIEPLYRGDRVTKR